MKKLLFVVAACLTLLTVISCNREEGNVNIVDFDLSKKGLKSEEVEQIILNYSKLQEKFKTGKYEESLMEAEIQEVMMPFVENGQILQTEIINRIDLSDPIYEFTAAEIEEFKNLDDKQLANLSLFVSVNNFSAHNRSRAVSCLAAALGVNEAIGLFSNLSKLMTVEGTMAAAKLVIRRTAGWLAVGLAVYSFGDCMGYY